MPFYKQLVETKVKCHSNVKDYVPIEDLSTINFRIK